MSMISIIIPTFNSEKYVFPLLSRLKGFTDDIIIVDSFSKDNTVSFAKEFSNVRVFLREYINSADQKNWALNHARYDYVMFIDSDELPERALLDEISELGLRGFDSVSYKIPRKNLIYGKFYKRSSLYPDYQSRLFNKQKCRWQERYVHAQNTCYTESKALKNALIHDDFTSLEAWWSRNNRYFEYEVNQYKSKKVKWSFKLQYVKPLYVFIRIYFGKRAFLDGNVGFFVSFSWLVYHYFSAIRLKEYEEKETFSIRNSK